MCLASPPPLGAMGPRPRRRPGRRLPLRRRWLRAGRCRLALLWMSLLLSTPGPLHGGRRWRGHGREPTSSAASTTKRSCKGCCAGSFNPMKGGRCGRRRLGYALRRRRLVLPRQLGTGAKGPACVSLIATLDVANKTAVAACYFAFDFVGAG